MMDEFQDNRPSFYKINFGRQITEHTHVPTRFARKHLPEQHTTKIILRSSEDKSCLEVIYVSRGRNRWFYRGWGVFVRDNKLKVGDTCIFELLAKDEMRVHIFRALRENSAS